jgi:hypothetical protein
MRFPFAITPSVALTMQRKLRRRKPGWCDLFCRSPANFAEGFRLAPQEGRPTRWHDSCLVRAEDSMSLFAANNLSAAEVGDYSSYAPLAKTAWAKNGGGEEDLTFADLLDAINPLQHLPIVSIIYRAITGEKIGLAAKLVGDTLYGGGPIAFLASGVSAVFEGASGTTASDMLADAGRSIFGGGPRAGTPRDAVAAYPTETAPTAEPEQIAAVDEAPAAGDETAQRIARSVEQAQRAQAGLLLATIEPAAAPRTPKEPPQPNPYLPPPARNAPGWSGESIAETIARYERAVAATRR